MINFCKKRYKKKIYHFYIKILKILTFKMQYYSSFYTIQFISKKKRQKLIDKIANSLNWGGAFYGRE